MLSASERDALYAIIVQAIGDDPSIRQVKSMFNENTVTVVEEMFRANKTCNANMQELAITLVGSGQILAKGWLKKALKFAKKRIKGMEFHGLACQVGVKSRWRKAIIISVY